jgi:hypothetical protein
MEILDEKAQAIISSAYDNLKKKDFLEKVFEYVQTAHEAEVTKINAERWAGMALQKLIDASKTKPGPKPKVEELELT